MAADMAIKPAAPVFIDLSKPVRGIGPQQFIFGPNSIRQVQTENPIQFVR